MTRRIFSTGLATGLAAALARPAGAAYSGKVIDVAVHFYDTARPQGVPWPAPRETVLYKPTLPVRYLEAIKPYRVDGVVAIEASPWLEDNLWLLNLGEVSPLIRGVVGNIPPGHPDFRSALSRFSKHPLFRGIRANAGSLAGMLSDSEALSHLRMLMEKNLSLDVLLGPPIFDVVARAANMLPDLRIVAGHLPLDAKNESGLRACGQSPNVFAKVSGVVRRPAINYQPGLDELWNVFGPDRVLYASNWPTSDLIAAYPAVYQAVADYLSDKSADIQEKFFWRNSTRVYRL